METKKSPRSEKPLHLISSLKSDDQFRLYDRSNFELENKGTSEDRSFGRVFVRAQTNRLNLLFRRSLGPPASFPDISRPDLCKAVERIRNHVEERDSELQLLREEN